MTIRKQLQMQQPEFEFRLDLIFKLPPTRDKRINVDADSVAKLRSAVYNKWDTF